MKKVKLLVKYKDNKKGKIIEVENNTAHALIEKGIAKLYVPKTRMMNPSKGKGYKIK